MNIDKDKKPAKNDLVKDLNEELEHTGVKSYKLLKEFEESILTNINDEEIKADSIKIIKDILNNLTYSINKLETESIEINLRNTKQSEEE
tara:strand:+ start:238 stop:507 length:270 start_codon:yes stop_codon:yes gene_type:complete